MGEQNRDRDTHIPPPSDPFQTYQTPYPRPPSESEDNPFILFRRYADAQFSSLFREISRSFGRVPPPPPEANHSVKSDAGIAHLQDRIQDMKENLERFHDRTERLMQDRKDMVRALQAYEQVEGLRKQLEQEREERRAENLRRTERESEQWDMMMRGIEKCPDLQSDALAATRKSLSDTELDMYNDLKARESLGSAHGKSDTPAETLRRRQGWLSGMGWDGKVKREASRLDNAKMSDANTGKNKHEDRIAEQPDPLRNEYKALQWWVGDEYSPLALTDTTSSPCPFEQRLAHHVDWRAAFDELLLVSDHDDPWVHDLASTQPIATALTQSLGLLFDPRQIHDFLSSQERHAGLFNGLFGMSVPAWADSLEQALLSDWKHVWDPQNQPHVVASSETSKQEQSSDSAVNDDALSDPDNVVNLVRRVDELRREPQTPVSEDRSSSQVHACSSAHISQPSSSTSTGSVVSMLTTIQSRTLPDGSIETKRVLKKRFADGREDCEESVEVQPVLQPAELRGQHMPSQTTDRAVQTQAEELLEKPQKRAGSGWFWH